jgi:hypothetical protein
MRLRRVSHLVVSSVLASCGGDDAHRAVTIAPVASASVSARPLPPSDVMDVVPTDPNAKMRFVSLAEIVGALTPPDPKRAALYAADPVSSTLQRVHGPSAEDACNAELQAFCGNFAWARWFAVGSDGTVTRGTLADLDHSRAHDPTITRALAMLTNAPDVRIAGVWFIDGEPAMMLPAARALTQETKIAPTEDAMPIVGRVSSHVGRLRSLRGDARERALLALGLPALDRAVLRVLLATPTMNAILRARMTPLARGWMIEAFTDYDGGGCGSSEGSERIVVLGSNVIVDARSHAYPRPCKGRRPPHLEFTESGRFFEDAAALEAASVDAFDLVARELESFGAPADLVHRARAAARDEIRHAEMMSKRAGIARPHVSRKLRERTPFEAALDNAVEGCVHESFAAIVARFQSRAAHDPNLARDFESIADDECAHGDLAWDIAAWLEPRLSSVERARISNARERAKREISQHAFEAAGGIDDEATRDSLGLPTRTQAVALAKAFVALV